MRTRTIVGLGLVLVGTLAYRHAGAEDGDAAAAAAADTAIADNAIHAGAVDPVAAPPSRLEIAKAATRESRVALARAAEAARERARIAARDGALPLPTTGELRGLVLDEDGEPVPGTTVIVTTPTGTVAAITDDDGEYRITALAPSEHGYPITFYYLEQTIETTIDRVDLGEPAIADLTMALHGNGGAGTMVQGITIDNPYIHNIPVPGRTFEAALGAAAGSQGDAYGISFTGTTTLENTYYIDGDVTPDDDAASPPADDPE